MTDKQFPDEDFREVKDEEKQPVEKSLEKDHGAKEESTETGEHFCAMCHLPESRAGKLTDVPPGIKVCQSCLQKAFDVASRMDFSQMQNKLPPNMVFKGSFDNLEELMAELNHLSGQLPPQRQTPAVKNNTRKVPKKIEFPQEEKLENGEENQKKKLPAPHKIKAMLDQYVIGQEHAKKAISVAVYNHYKRVMAPEDETVEIQKSNILMIGPTGSGKTYLVQTLARLLDVPLAIADATSLTEAGYIGDDIESVLSKLLSAAGDDVARAEQGIVFIDEIDKLARKKNSTSRDVSGESVQQGLLKLLEGSVAEVPVGATSKNAMVPVVQMDTKNILFICGGAFPDLEDIVKERLRKKSSIGFQSSLKDAVDQDRHILQKIENQDLRAFGMIPEFLGRLPVVFSLEPLDEEMLIRVLKEPRNAILRQYEKLLEMDEVKLDFTEGALRAISRKALKKDTGARALRAIIEEFMLDIMYEIPKDPSIGHVTITEEYVEHRGAPLIELRGEWA